MTVINKDEEILIYNHTLYLKIRIDDHMGDGCITAYPKKGPAFRLTPDEVSIGLSKSKKSSSSFVCMNSDTYHAIKRSRQ